MLIKNMYGVLRAG